MGICCPKKKQTAQDDMETGLLKDSTYQGVKQLETGGKSVAEDHSDSDPDKVSNDDETDNEDGLEVFASVKKFLQDQEPNDTKCHELNLQFMKLIKRRKFRRTMVYLGNRTDLTDYKKHVQQRLRGMILKYEPVPEKDNVELVTEMMTKLVFDQEIRQQIVMSVNSHMSAE